MVSSPNERDAPPRGQMRYEDTNPEDVAVESLVEKICSIDGCTREDAVRQILAFEKAFSEL